MHYRIWVQRSQHAQEPVCQALMRFVIAMHLARTVASHNPLAGTAVDTIMDKHTQWRTGRTATTITRMARARELFNRRAGLTRRACHPQTIRTVRWRLVAWVFARG